MSSIEEKCKIKGVRLTDQRKLIAKIMSEAKDHPDVDELHRRVSAIDKKGSIASNNAHPTGVCLSVPLGLM